MATVRYWGVNTNQPAGDFDTLAVPGRIANLPTFETHAEHDARIQAEADQARQDYLDARRDAYELRAAGLPMNPPA